MQFILNLYATISNKNVYLNSQTKYLKNSEKNNEMKTFVRVLTDFFFNLKKKLKNKI